MVLEEVYLSSDIYLSCLQLALSTEKEEIICLLLGETKEENDKEQAHIYAMKIPHRMDKKKDRVEISIDQLLASQEYAEVLSQKYNKEIRVLGWFHSHPHITVWPSHVDVNTQANYQLMSSSFVGIICSVFSEDKATRDNEINLTCFQSESTTNINGTVCHLRKPIPFYVVPKLCISTDGNCLQTICELPSILYQEEKESFSECFSEVSNILTSVHNEMLLTKSLLHITNKVSIPLLKCLETREEILRNKIAFTKKMADLGSYFGGLPSDTKEEKS